MTVSSAARTQVGLTAIAAARWRWPEVVFWLLAASTILLFPNRYLLLTEIPGLAPLAMSLDLILGQVSQAEAGQGRVEYQPDVVQGELSFDPDLQFPSFLFELPSVEAAVGRQPEINTAMVGEILRDPGLVDGR